MPAIMEESMLEWTLNDHHQAPILCSPGREDLLLSGFMLTEGYVSHEQDIISILPGPVWQVSTRVCPDDPASLRPLENECTFSLDSCLEQYQAFLAFGKTAGQHCMMLTDGMQKAVGRDISRHNALDRAVGAALRSGMLLSASLLLSSGRITLTLLEKAARAGIPVLITGKQIGSLSIARARELNIALVQAGTYPSVLGCTARIEEG